jgi:hypothetical protein
VKQVVHVLEACGLEVDEDPCDQDQVVGAGRPELEYRALNDVGTRFPCLVRGGRVDLDRIEFDTRDQRR